MNSDDGFRCQIGTNSFEFPSPRGASDTLATFQLAAGRYPVRLVYFQCEVGAELEFFAAAGTHAFFNSSFRLLGDTAGGGLEMRSTPDGTPSIIMPEVSHRPRLVRGTVVVGDRPGPGRRNR